MFRDPVSTEFTAIMLAVHFIWTTYGTWLPGDARGHWSPLFDMYGHVVAKGGKLNSADLITREQSQTIMKEPPKVLNEDEIAIVANQIETLTSPRLAAGPQVSAIAIEPNHVHLLTDVPREPLGRFVGRLKGTTASAVLNISGNEQRWRIWTANYWKVYLFNHGAVVAVQKYIEDHNVRRGLPAAPYPWVQNKIFG